LYRKPTPGTKHLCEFSLVSAFVRLNACPAPCCIKRLPPGHSICVSQTEGERRERGRERVGEGKGGGRERGREGEREGGREGGRAGGRAGGREGGRRKALSYLRPKERENKERKEDKRKEKKSSFLSEAKRDTK
jgi:hypothetical protein